MAKRNKKLIKRSVRVEARHTCGECSRGVYSEKHINKNVNGEPFLIECEHSEWAVNADGAHVCLRSTTACKMFEAYEV